MIPRVIHHSSMTKIQLLQECRHQILSFCLIVRHYSCTAPEPAQQASEFTRKDPVPLHCMTLSQVTSSCTAVHSSNHHIQPTDFEPNWMTLKPSNLGGRAAAQVPACPPSFGGVGGGVVILSVLEDQWGSAIDLTRTWPRSSVAWLHGGHCRVTREGLVILVAWSRVGRQTPGQSFNLH